MKGKHLVFAAILIGLCVAGLLSYSPTRAETKIDSPSATELSIPFGDKDHKVFFNYQAYLITQGKPAETKESWKQLTSSEHIQKVTAGDVTPNSGPLLS